MSAPPPPQPTLRHDLHTARTTIRYLLDAGITPNDARLEALLNVTVRGLHSAHRDHHHRRVLDAPVNSAVEQQRQHSNQAPLNSWHPLSKHVAQIGAPVSDDGDFVQYNQRAIAAARVALEDPYSHTLTEEVSQQHPLPPLNVDDGLPCAPDYEPASIFQEARIIQLEAAIKKIAARRSSQRAKAEQKAGAKAAKASSDLDHKLNASPQGTPTKLASSPELLPNGRAEHKSHVKSPSHRLQSPRLPVSPMPKRPIFPTFSDQRPFASQSCYEITAEQAFQIKAQVEAYRRLLRGMEIPAEVNIAAHGRAAKLIRPAACGGVVRRGVDEDGFEESKKPFYNPNGLPSFDPRLIKRRPLDHTFTKEDVTLPGESNLSAAEISERIQVAHSHHKRLHAEYFRSKKQIRKVDESTERIDPLVSQRFSHVMGNMKPRKSEEMKNDIFDTPKVEKERFVVRRRERALPSIKPSVAREEASAPITVSSKTDRVASYQELLQERRRRVQQRIESRLDEIKVINSSVPDEVRQNLLVEEKGLKLVALQRKLRENVMRAMNKALDRRGVDDIRPHKLAKMIRKSQPTPVRFSTGTSRSLSNGQYRAQRELQRRTRRTTYLQNLLQHAQQFKQSFNSSNSVKKKLLKELDKFFRDRSREEERRRKKEQMDRLRALRNNNEDEYLELLRTTKNKRLIQLLKQTDEYLVQIGAQVERQKQTAREEDEAENGGGGNRGVVSEGAVSEKGEKSKEDENEDELSKMKKRRNDYYTITHTISEKVRQPDILLGGTLKHYQMEGLEWLVSLYNNNLNGILADEMGLGKTIQTLSLITYLMEVKKLHGPYLVIVPLSVISNWVRELNIWAPSVVKVVYKGDPTTRKQLYQNQMQAGTYNIVLTTYEFIVKDKNILGRIKWKYIIMDEGHRMKNADCKLALTLGAKYTSRNRLLLTGTPLQNNMTELWALLNFLLPSIFSSAETFETWFNAPFQESSLGDSAELNEEENLLIISRLHQVLRPFMLRRLKTDVEKQLPDKVENVFRCEMSIWQRVLNRQMRSRIGIAAGTNLAVRSFNNMVMQLKKVCNHPFLFYSEEELLSIPRDFLIRASGKFELLEHVLRKLKRTGHRVLMFSQMTAALDYLEHFLYNIGMKYLRLDGTTKADFRQNMLELFNAPDSEYFCFLLSTRAGGLGLNLQTADTVIIFDSDWNPMMDLQAQDRAHRIGQTKEVRVYRLICSGSVEVKILERANRKLQMDAQVIQAGQFNNKSSDQDRKEMLKDLLRQQNEDDTRDEDSTPLAEINRLLARSEEELEVFEQIDLELEEAAKGKSRLLQDESELPAWVLLPEEQAKAKTQTEAEYLMEHGRGRRKRKEVLYDDNLTEREWTLAMEAEGDVENAARRKRKRLQNRGSVASSSTGDDLRRPSVPSTPVEGMNGNHTESFVDGADQVDAAHVEESLDQEYVNDHGETAAVEPPKKKRKRGRPRRGSGRRKR